MFTSVVQRWQRLAVMVALLRLPAMFGRFTILFTRKLPFVCLISRIKKICEGKIVPRSRESNRMRTLVVIIKFQTEIIILQKS